VADKENEMDMGTQQVRRLIRMTDNKMIAGVAAGLGDYFHVDPVWFRLGFVLTAFMGGFGVLIYAVLWVVMPEAGSAASNPAERGLERVAHSIRGTPAWIGVAMVILGVILALNAAVDWRPGVVWGIALIVLGALFFVQKDAPPAAVGAPDETRPVPPPQPSGPSATDTAVLEPPSGFGPPALPTAIPTGAAPPPPPRVRERSTLGFMTFGALLVAIGIATLLDVQNVITFEPVQYLAMALGIIGVGLLVGSVVGRARWLIVPGLVLLPFVFVASLIHVPWEGGFGQRHYRVTGTPSLVDEYRLIAGDMTIDLSDASTADYFRVEATAVAGHILIIVPEGLIVDIEAKAGGGQVDLFGRHDEGVNVNVHRIFGDGAEMTDKSQFVSLEIDVEVGLGQVEVRS
jgi:phage shock protein PspC (stress-responsive transcriptional regulator)